MASTDLFEKIFDEVDGALATYIIDTAGNVITFIAPLFTSLMIIWIAIWGYLFLLGKVNEPLQTGVFRILRMTFIITLGLTVTHYTDLVVHVLAKGPEQLAAVITGSPTGTSAATLDALFSSVFDVADAAYEEAGLWDNFGLYFIALIVLAVGAILVLFTAFLLLLSKIAMTVLLAIGPLFIVLLLFNATQRFFEAWLGMVCNYGLLLVLTAAIGTLMVSLAESYINAMGTDASALANLADAAMLCIVLGLCILVNRQVPSIAAALGGGVALATQGAIGATLNALRPSTLRQAKREVQLAKRGLSRLVSGPYRTAQRGYAAYQKRFGGNTLKAA